MSSTKITPLDPNTLTFEEYSVSDKNLIDSSVTVIPQSFDVSTDYIETWIYDLNGNILEPDTKSPNYNFSVLNNILQIDPEGDVNYYYNDGVYNIIYNFYKNEISSSIDKPYFIKEISPSRTELRISSTYLSNLQITDSVNNFIESLKLPVANPDGEGYNNNLFSDFYLNFNENQVIIANNIQLSSFTNSNGTLDVYIKLYEPLPNTLNVNSTFNVVTKVGHTLAYQVEFISEPVIFGGGPYNYISGPNYNLGIKDQENNSSEFLSLVDISSSLSASQYQLESLFNVPGVEISLDYSQFSNFINFSSAEARINNFVYKLGIIESASNQLSNYNLISNPSSATSESIQSLNNIIQTTIQNFDGYEYYLYYESSSTAFPKTNSVYPYENASTSSLEALTWINNSLESGSLYDDNNLNILTNALPRYILDDPANNEFLNLLNMVGHFFDDNLWVYIKDITNKYNADNRLDYGVSKDLVAQVLRDLGVKLYQSNFGTSDIFTAFLGATSGGGLFPFPNITGSLPTPSGYEYVDTRISGSDDVVPLTDLQKRVYKRIYHNLPYLLKTKGTIESIRTLSTIFGIPDTLLQINEFGGKDKDNSNDWDFWFNKYDYKFDTEVSGFVSSSWELNNDWSVSPSNTVQFRFKTPDLDSAITTRSQSLWALDTSVYIALEYTGSGYESGSYSGSISSPEKEYAHLTIYPDYSNNPAQSASIYLPFFNGEWWSVMATLDSNTVTLYAGSKDNYGSNSSQLTYYAEKSVTGIDDTEWLNGTVSYFASESIYPKFSGSLQEIRYYTIPLSGSVFQDYIMNPQSIEGNGLNSGSEQLVFRASLGGELYTGSVSIHPKVSGSWATISSFVNDSIFYTTGSFTSNTEYVYLDQFPAGIKNRNSDKIKEVNLNLPSKKVLSNQISIQQKSYTEGNYTPNINSLEVTYSPQNEINDDIISSIGYFNIGDYIGDPRLISSSAISYPQFDNLRKAYFEKYTSNYDWNDYVRLIKFFDNSFFKMVKDFAPARTSLATGITIKQHILERQKYPTPQAELARYEYTGSIGQTSTLVDGQKEYTPSTDFTSIPLETITGSDGGAIITSNITQSWEGTRNTPVGQLSFIHNDESEFYDGEFSGSAIITTNGELNVECDPYKVEATEVITYNTVNNFYSTFAQFSSYLKSGGGQVNDDIWIWWERKEVRRGDYAPGYIDYVYSPAAIAISKESSNGINLDKYIPSAKEFTILANLASGDVTLSGWTPNYYPSYNLGNLKLKVTNLQEINGTSGLYNNYYYLLQLAPNSYNVTVLTDNSPGTVAISQQSNIQTILEPYVPETFAGSDCNAIYGNDVEARSSHKFYDLDYSSNAIQAINQQVVISASQQGGLSTFAPVQDYNWYSRRSIIPRYSGSRNTAEGYNAEQGFAPIDYTDPIILDFNWGGGTYPEIYGGGALSLNKMLFVNNNKESIGVFAANQPGFTGSVATAFPINSRPVFNQYSTTANTTDGARVSKIGISTPPVSNYMIFTGQSISNPGFGGNINVLRTSITFNVSASLVTTTPNGYYTTGSNIATDDMISNISSSLNGGDKWYVSIYQHFPSTVQGELEPWNSGSYADYTKKTNNGYDYPFTRNGVYEIISTGPSAVYIDPKYKFPDFTAVIGGTGADNFGMLIWKAQQGSFLLFNDATLSGVGKGGLLTSTPSTLVEDEFEYITQNFGSNPKPS